MNDNRAEDMDDERTLTAWIRRGVVHVPLLTWAWPGADPRVMQWPQHVYALRSHYYMHHCEWHFHWTFEKLSKEHDFFHLDPLWAHQRIESGQLLHVHQNVTSDTTEGEDWEW